ncbi:hypothetical protein [Rhodopseudomonas telluris]|uniref:Uncharacterized protein n=1 Tax=Rhodopseudomonas telluris TaxID=644215 RepID=A0ABV6ET13_9BRAD
MPYALYSDDAKISKAYPTEASVWKHAEDSGLVIDDPEDETSSPRRILDNGYEIRACSAEPSDNPNRKDADAEADYQLSRDAA